jgi:hypothetical protein
VAPAQPPVLAASAPPAPAPPDPGSSASPASDLDAFASSDEGEAGLITAAETTRAEPSATEGPAFDEALEPVRKRMERVKLNPDFVRRLLQAGAVLDAGEVALSWAGMPNKNERAATIEVLDALAAAGFLARDGERYRVLRVV